MSTSDKSLFALSTMTVACALAFGTFTAQAADVDTETVHELDKVTVDEAMVKPGQTVLTAAKLEMVPSTTGTITDAFRGESFVQFDQNSRNGGLGAEITPPQISIRGSRHYENNFSINGLSNNNMLNPKGWDASSNALHKPTSDAQAVMIGTDLLDNVKVFSENVSAEYGDFTGGVIDATIRDARTDRWHMKTWVRHTRDSWAQQHFTDTQKTKLDHPTVNDDLQDEFKKTYAGVTIEGPLADGKLGALLSYEKAHSSTPVYTNFANGVSEKHDAERDMDTFIARVNTDKNNDFYVAGTLIYSPYESHGHSADVKDSAFNQDGGGLNFTLNTRANLSFGTWTNDFGFSQTEANRETNNNAEYSWIYHPDNQYATWSDSDGYSSEGTQGDFKTDQDQYDFKTKLALNPIETGFGTHHVRVGAQATYTRVHSDVEEFVGYGNVAHKSDATNGAYVQNTVGNKSDGIISGEQVALRKRIQHGFDRTFDYLSLSAFVEDAVKIDRFTIRPGVRVSYDDLTEDVNVAPRFFANMDLFNDGRFNINVGANRYYGSQVLFDALNSSTFWKTREQQTRKFDSQGNLTGWSQGVDKTSFTGLGDIETPYADEITLGFSADIADTLFKVVAVKRDHKDQIRKTGLNWMQNPTCSELNNDGETNYKGVTFSIEKNFDLGTFGHHTSEFGITWSEMETNAVIWNDAWEDQLSGGVYFDGKYLADIEDIKAPNFNAEWVLTYAHDASFMDDRLRTNMLLRWESASDRIMEVAIADRIDNKRTFKTVEQDHMFNADLSVAYDLIKTANSTLTLNMDVFNVFDNKNLVNTSTGAIGSTDHYSMGRQFYLGMSYQY